MKEIFEISSLKEQKGGSQILHFNSTNKPYFNDPQAVEFVKNNLASAQALTSDAETLHFASHQVSIDDGEYIELGVCTGKTINFLAALNPTKLIHGFDSFEGLPEDWGRGGALL